MGLSRIHAYVGVVGALAVTTLVVFGVAFPARDVFPGWWGVFVFAFLAFLLEVSRTSLRAGTTADGSLSFLTYLAAFVLFGGFWAGTIVAVSTLAGQVALGRPPTRLIFNTSQQVLAILATAGVYSLLGGAMPLTLVAGAQGTFEVVMRDLGAFVAGVVAYFIVNSLAVSGAVAISSGRSFGAVWKTNTLWVLSYDIAASSISLGAAWLYSFFDHGLARLGFLAVLLPIVAVKHVYGKLNVLQHLYDEVDQAYERLERNVREQLAVMVKSIEARDPYTSGHSMRVSAISRALATDFGLSDELVQEVENAALLHDVGKIHAEFAPLLQKEGKLSPEEWEVMKTHAGKSAELVGLFSRFAGHVQDSVRHHHERWDGLGYPDGLTGENIPLGSRVIMIADTVDAMTTDRPYRKALPFEAVVAELLKHRGKQFDPRLVDCAVNSVSLRRIASQPGVSQLEAAEKAKAALKPPPLRSYASFFTGLRSARDPR